MASRDRVTQAKSRAERSRPPTVPVPQVEIVPGRLSEGEWLSLLGCEEAEDSVGDLLAGLLDQVLEDCYRVYLDRQCIPYVVNQAREAMLQILEWRFLVRDEGEADVPADPSWQEEEEPAPCTTDSWAQGSVRVLPARPHLEEAEVPSAGLSEETPASEEAPRDTAGATQPPQGSLLREEATEGGLAGPSLQKVEPPCGPSHSNSGLLVRWAVPLPGTATSVPPHPPKAQLSCQQPRGQPLHTTRFGQVVQPLESSEKELLLRELSQVPVEEEEEGLPLLPSSCSNLLRIQLGRPPNIKAVFYDESGNITLAPRLDPARLPKRWIKPCVEVVDPDVESRRQEALKTVSGRCRPRRPPKLPRGRVDARDPSGALPPPGGPQVLLWDGAATVLPKRLSEQAPCPAQPPPGRALEPSSLVFVKPTLLTERVEPAPGVTIRPGGSTARRPPPAVPPPLEQAAEAATTVPRDLRPLRPPVPFPPEAPVEQQCVPEPRPLPRLRPGTVL